MQGVYGVFHIVYLVVAVMAMILEIIILKKKKISDDKLQLILKIEGAIWLISVLLNRFVVTYSDVVINNREGYTWLNLIPNTYCGICSLVLSISLMTLKKDNFIFHSLGYLGLVGGFVTMLYPDFLDSQSIFDLRSITGLLHHTLMFSIMLKMMLFGYMQPTIKKCSYFTLGICVIMTLGVLEKDAFKFTKAMEIGDPLLKSLKVLTSWYITDLLLIICHFVFLVIHEKRKTHENLKDILKKVR